jgi:hypothetical protein
MGYMLKYILKERKGKVASDEIGIPVISSGLVLPAGATSIWQAWC